MEITSTSVLVAIRAQLSSNLGGETVILHLGAGVYYGLDEVGARVWAMLQAPRAVSDLCRELLTEYDVEPGRCERALLDLLGELASAGLIERVDEPAA